MITPVDLHNEQRKDHSKKAKWFFNLKAAIKSRNERQFDESKTIRRLMNSWKGFEGEYLQLVQPITNSTAWCTMNCIDWRLKSKAL